MLIEELKLQLGVILSKEEGGDWDCVESLSNLLHARLITELETPNTYPMEGVLGYLAGHSRRCKDEDFARQQRRWLTTYLRGH